MRRVGVTGANGLIGWHAAARLRAARAAMQYRGEAPDIDVLLADRSTFEEPDALQRFVAACDVLLHFAGVNRGSEDDVAAANDEITARLVEALERSGGAPTLVFANSTHAERDTSYGHAKRRASERFQAWADSAGASFVDVIIPHVFGEHARPFYNNVTATFIQQVLDSEPPVVNPDGRVELVHAGAVASAMTDLGLLGAPGSHRLTGVEIGVPALLARIQAFHDTYEAGVFPDVSDAFARDLFNAYRAARGPSGWARQLQVSADDRGRLFETAKGGGGGQTFVSWTHPGVTRGHHFHLHKVERFVVIEGEAVIRLRRVLHDDVHEFAVSGVAPQAIDIPTLYTHSIENVGAGPLVTLFWTHELFDPANPDTYAEQV